MRTLAGYMARELAFPFATALFVFTFILLMDKLFTLADLVIQYGIGLDTVGRLLAYILPATFAITVPMACLVGVIVAFSRLKGDNELMAVRASGISLLPLVGVALVLGALLTAGMIVFNNRVLPAANYAYKTLYYDIVSQRASIVIQDHIFVDDFDGYVFRVNESDPASGELKGIVVMVLPRRPEDPLRTIFAERGRLITDRASRRVMLRLEDGYMQMVPPEDPWSFTRIDFHSNLLDLDIHQSLARQRPDSRKSAREMSMTEIQQGLAEAEARGENVNLFRVEYHKKLSIPFACLVFVLIGAPLGILAPRSGKLLAYFFGVLLIFMYYIMLSLGETFGVDGRMHPFWSMWLPNLFLLLAGAYGLVWIALERMPVPRVFRGRRP